MIFLKEIFIQVFYLYFFHLVMESFHLESHFADLVKENINFDFWGFLFIPFFFLLTLFPLWWEPKNSARRWGCQRSQKHRDRCTIVLMEGGDSEWDKAFRGASRPPGGVARRGLHKNSAHGSGRSGGWWCNQKTYLFIIINFFFCEEIDKQLKKNSHLL